MLTISTAFEYRLEAKPLYVDDAGDICNNFTDINNFLLVDDQMLIKPPSTMATIDNQQANYLHNNDKVNSMELIKTTTKKSEPFLLNELTEKEKNFDGIGQSQIDSSNLTLLSTVSMMNVTSDLNDTKSICKIVRNKKVSIFHPFIFME